MAARPWLTGVLALVGFLCAYPAWSLSQEAAQDETQEAAHDEIQAAAKESYLSKWRRFRQATRDITQWDFAEGMFQMRFGARYQLDFTAG